MNKVMQLTVFNKILDNLFEYLEENFPKHKSDIVLNRSAIELVRKGNPRLVAEQFMKSVLPFKKQILECDEKFFLNYEENLKDVVQNNSTEMLSAKIRQMWLNSTTTDNQKAHIWLYFHKLIKIGEELL